MPKVERFETRVQDPETGKVRGGGSVETVGVIRMSRGEGCGVGNCHCSDGYWVSIIGPVNKKGVVEGMRFTFDSKEQMDVFLNGHEFYLKAP